MTLPLRLLYRVGRALLLLFLLLFLGACASGFLPASPAGNVGSAATPTDERIGPRPPVAYPDPLSTGGRGISDFTVLDGMDDAMADALACLAKGQPVFAVMQYNANVRNEANSQGCRLGRAPAGTVVRVEAIFGQGETTPFASLDHSLSLLPLSTPGYDEDIQPIFEENCSVCHSDTLQLADLHVTAYERLLAGGQSGPVVVPGDPDASQLWLQVRSGAMPLVGELNDEEKSLVYEWILAGADRLRFEDTRPAAELWLRLSDDDFSWSPNDCAEDGGTIPYINAQLAVAASCAAIPTAEQVAASLLDVQPLTGSSSPTGLSSPTSSPTSLPSSGQSDSDERDGAAALPILDNLPSEITAGNLPRDIVPRDIVGIEVSPLGLGVPSEADPWLIPRGGFCIEQYLDQVLQDRHSITSLAFAPDGRLFMALDIPATGDYDPNLLYDPFYPVRTVAVWDGDRYEEVLRESSRITGMAWHEGALYLNRAAEVGRIPDGGTYEYLAGGFAVAGRLFHANNGLVVRDGWLYVAAGGVRDGYSDGTIVPADGDLPAETLATFVAAGGNRFSARIVRARLEQLLAERTLAVFQTVARGVRNPYGIATDPFGRIWFTDNGATNVPGTFGAGDEVNLLDPRRLSAAAVAGDENDTPFYGFPMTLGGAHKEWWSEPVLPLSNSAAPTGITWAYDTIFFAQYGRDPGLYRMALDDAKAGGAIIAERVLLGWPIQAVTTAPDGAVWIGTGTGGLFRLVPGCAG